MVLYAFVEFEHAVILQVALGVFKTCMLLSSLSQGALISVAAFCRFDGFAEETVTVQRLPGWFKQRSNRLYPVRILMCQKFMSLARLFLLWKALPGKPLTAHDEGHSSVGSA